MDMEDSMTLMNASIHFIDARLSLIHIPLPQYASYLQSILELLFPAIGSGNSVSGGGDAPTASQIPWSNQYPFLNVSVTPVECSIVCPTAVAEQIFRPTIAQVSQTQDLGSGRAIISTEDYVVISIQGEGMEAGQRVLDLTSPLALAGIPIFFITTYFSDYILVPAKSRNQVIRALEERGFAFDKSAEAYVNVTNHQRNKSSSSSNELRSPTTPPPATVSELQARTSTLLKRHGIFPQVNTDIRLVRCAGRRDQPGSPSADEAGLQLGLIKCLVHKPRFLCLTLTKDEPASLLLEKRLMANFSADDVLFGNKEDHLTPIILDLEPLPLEATGIVCGVAGQLVGGSSGSLVESIEMTYLSTVRAGTVMVDEKDLKRAMEYLGVGGPEVVE